MDPKLPLRKANHKHPKNWKGPPTDQDRKVIYSLAAYGATNEDMAAVLGMDDKTLCIHFRKEIDTGRSTAKNTIAERLYNIAVGRGAIYENGNLTHAELKPSLGALIFLAKTRLGWKETQVVEAHNFKGGVQVYLPDNGMREDNSADD